MPGEGSESGRGEDAKDATAASSRPDSRRSLCHRLAWLPIPLLLAAIIAGRAAGWRESYQYDGVRLVLSFIFYTLVSLGTLYLIGRSFLAQGALGLLLLECGVVLWSLAGTVADAVSQGDANVNVTVFNAGILLAGLCHLAGAALSLREQRSLRARPLWLAAGWAFALASLGLITWATLAGWLPVFFVPGQGGTPVRYWVLVSAISTFVLSAGLLRAGQREPRTPFTTWYTRALLLLSVGLFGIMIQLSLGSVVNWLSRTAEWLGGVYLLLAAVAAIRESSLPLLPLGGKLRPAYYGNVIAVAMVLAATAMRLAFLSAMGTRAPFVLFYPAVILAALYGGWRAGLLATGLSAILADYFWIKPAGRLALGEPADLLGLAVFLLTGAIIAWFTEALHRARTRAAAAETQVMLAAEREAAAQKLRMRNAVLQGINRIFEQVLTQRSEEDLGRTCLAVAEEITASKLGFVGEVGADGLFHDIAISDPGWEACKMSDATGHRRPPVNFVIHGIYGRVLKDGKPVLTNDPDSHPDRIGLPPGHAPLNAFLGVPLLRGGRTIGMIAVANREGGYGENDVQALEALAPAIVEAFQRKRAEEALRKSEQEFRTLAEAVPQIVWATRPDGWNIYFNQQWVDYTGLTLDESYGHGWNTPFHPDDKQRAWDAWQRATQHDKPYLLECRLRRADGVYRWWLIHGTPLHDENGEIQKWLGTCTDIEDLKRAEEALLRAKEAAEAANEAKSQFLANMSHELRTPMNAILGMIDVALPKAADPIVQDCLHTAKGSADLLLTLLNDLLDSAKIESGKLELESAAFSLRRMLDQITRVLSVRASEKGLAFYCRLPEETPEAVIGDRMRLQQVLLNLAGNAIKFTERGDVEITLRASSRPLAKEGQGVRVAEQSPHPSPLPEGEGTADLEFAVRDTGIGIPPSSLERLFQPFGQADASMSRRFGGTGLGLSICKSLVEMMGGRIWVESEVGVGSTFYFTVRLPLAEELPADFEAPTALPTAACGQLRVLLVEDNPANQKLATYILQDRGHVVEVAGDGQEAIWLTEQNRYDVILMDVQMPGMNGLEATAAIRKREAEGLGAGGSGLESGELQRTPDSGHPIPSLQSLIPASRVPIVAMTAHAMKGDRERCLAAGMDGYLSKPVNAQEMIGLVEGLAGELVPPRRRAAAPPSLTDTSLPAAAVVFNPDEAITRCFNSRDMVCEMIQCFFDEVDNLFPQMRAALAEGNLVEVGHLGHRMKGTVVYLGAQPAQQAALRVERFCKSDGGTSSEAEEAVNALEHECIVLKAALVQHPLASERTQEG